jgi:hypothetical protein
MATGQKVRVSIEDGLIVAVCDIALQIGEFNVAGLEHIQSLFFFDKLLLFLQSTLLASLAVQNFN